MDADCGHAPEQWPATCALEWTPASRAPALGLEDVHVWRAELDTLRPRLRSLERLLSGEEARRAARFAHADDRARHMLARGLLRLLLGDYTALAPERVAFRVGAHGKPALDPPTVDLSFNASHAGAYILLAFARRREVGVDVEQIGATPDGDLLAGTFFSPEEQATLRALDGEERASAFTVYWTRKEAYLKATGEGLYAGLGSFTMSLRPAPPTRPVVLDRVGRVPQTRWALYDLAPIAGYAAALALGASVGLPARITCLRYQP